MLKNRYIIGCLALNTIFVLAEPLFAMNDPAIGRWGKEGGQATFLDMDGTVI